MTIPIVKKSGKKQLVKDVRIDYDTNWRRLHRYGITSAYNSSPFFEFYSDQILPYFDRHYDFLVDLCFELTLEITKMLGLKNQVMLTSSYVFKEKVDLHDDFRESIHPKSNYRTDPNFILVEYPQVFNEKIGFLPNLSILDLIFNTGPEARVILSQSFK